MATPPSKSNTPETVPAVPATVEQQLAALEKRVSVLEARELARTSSATPVGDAGSAPVGKLQKKAVPPEFQGAKTYVVGPKKHYRDGRVYQAGELITVVNERPASDWTPHDPSAAAKPAAPSTPAKRAADSDAA